MASPVYNTAGFRGGSLRRRKWGIAIGGGSILGGETPRYLGAGQPVIEASGSWFGDGTPVYRTAPDKIATSNAAPTPPSTTASDTTMQPPAPPTGQMTLVFPGS
jgi:hypothetical protein